MARVGKQMLLLGFVVLGACGRKPPPPFPTYEPAPEPFASPGFTDLERASDLAERAGKKYLLRTRFTPAMRKNLVTVLAPSIRLVDQGTRRGAQFAYRPVPPFQAAPKRAGWRLIGRTLAWRIQESVKAGRYDAAVADVLITTRFGTTLLGGSVEDATLGCRIIDDARRALAPSLASLGAGQLGRLAQGLRTTLQERPPMDRMIANEWLNMRLAVQTVQSHYQNRQVAALRKQLGVDAKEGLDFLESLKPDAAPGYFDGFLREADAQREALLRLAKLPAVQRKEAPGAQLEEYRPWRRLARNFFVAGDTLFAMNDMNLARTRLFAIECGLLRSAKTSGALPKDLSKFDALVATDPYSGGAFMLHRDGLRFVVYSVGENLLDDGGETDASFRTPDLTIERPR